MRYLVSAIVVIMSSLLVTAGAQSMPAHTLSHRILPGDTWLALSLRYDLPATELQAHAGSINTQQQPSIGSTIEVPAGDSQYGRLLRPFSGGLLQTAALRRQSPWALASRNGLIDPYQPLLYTPILIPDETAVPRELPAGFRSLSLLPSPAIPGQALMLQAQVVEEQDTAIQMDELPWLVHHNGRYLLALSATGAFFDAERVNLTIRQEHAPLWEQPWLFDDSTWTYEQIEFSSSPATDPELMRAERERLQTIWAVASPEPLWQGPFHLPLLDFVELTSHYGARRSVNGGGYDTYHEGTDFSAYGGTPVLAPASGIVVLAENLTVRGGTVILDHGLGIHTGYYHLSEISVQPGQAVKAGEILGGVGTTGRSTGNHLHWDLLIGTTWVDAEAWLATHMATHIQVAWGADFPTLDRRDIPNQSGRELPRH